MRLIPLTKGQFAKVDDEDYHWLMNFSWNAEYLPKRGNYRTCAKGRGVDADKTIRMHRLVMGAQPGQQVDHEDQDPLNNQKYNLRFCTSVQNRSNVKKTNRPRSSRFKGVSLKKNRNLTKPWLASIMSNKHPLILGLYSNEIEAARAYDAAASVLHGDFASLNFPVVVNKAQVLTA